MRIRKLTAGAMVISMTCLPAANLWAADGETPNPNAAIEAQTAATNARANLVNAQKALVDAQTGALGLPKYDGKTTMGEGAGAMEADMLSASAVDAAAKLIVERINTPDLAGKSVLLLSESDAPALGLPAMMESQIELLSTGLATATPSSLCSAKSAPSVAMLADGGMSTAVLGAVLGLFKTNTTVTGLALTQRDEMLMNAVASQAGPNWIFPGDLLTVSSLEDSMIGRKWTALTVKRQAALACRNRLESKGDDKAKPAIANIDAAVASIDEFAKTVFTASDAGITPFGAAIRMETLRKGDPWILRLKVEKAGGTMLQQENLYTFFGASGVRITGGLVVTYRLSNPATGRVGKAGVLVCRTAMKSLKAIQAGDTGVGVCNTTAKAPSRKP